MNIKKGLKIEQINHPEYGTWAITGLAADGVWNVRGRTGGITVSESELMKFWKEAE